ncbi:helix-turn-helix domain-containing protein [Mycolicibacterium gadium]|jgi:AcrR family transcriptional regulator|uniref:helix-turn-helix domain-containing protein n=1 Tax=Mycolicibacterium gadium TaxID=1794 RepID=UPI002FDD61D7
MSQDKSRDDVLASARQACADERQPTMEQFAASAGVAVRTLYRLFGSRDALLREAGCAQEPSARQRVLDAALDQVGRQGLAELSMDELAAAAGVSRATLYRLFPGKSALFGELIREFSPWEPVADVIDAMPEGHPEDVMPAVAHAIAEAMQGRVGVLLRMVFELLRGDPDTAEGMRESMARGLPDLLGYLTNQMQAGRLRQMQPVLAAQLLAGPIVVHLLTRPLAEALIGFETPQSELLDDIVHAWLRAMAPESHTEADAG